MLEDEIKQKMKSLEKRLIAIESKKKDIWDIFKIIASLLIPLAIAFSGYYFSTAMKAAEIKSNEVLASRQESIAIINAKVAQARLIASFLEPLTGDDAQKKKIAIKGILIALPDEGPNIVSTISVTDESEEIQRYAKSSLDKRRRQLIQDIFSKNKRARISATTELVSGWRKDEKLVPLMLDFAISNISHKSGAINTLVVLQNVDAEFLKENQNQLEAFFEKAAPNGLQTKQHIDKVRERL
jgi:hypothetical protein